MHFSCSHSLLSLCIVKERRKINSKRTHKLCSCELKTATMCLVFILIAHRRTKNGRWYGAREWQDTFLILPFQSFYVYIRIMTMFAFHFSCSFERLLFLGCFFFDKWFFTHMHNASRKMVYWIPVDWIAKLVMIYGKSKYSTVQFMKMERSTKENEAVVGSGSWVLYLKWCVLPLIFRRLKGIRFLS